MHLARAGMAPDYSEHPPEGAHWGVPFVPNLNGHLEMWVGKHFEYRQVRYLVTSEDVITSSRTGTTVVLLTKS